MIDVTTPQEELEAQLMASQDNKEVTEIVDIFNANIKKRDIIRANKFSALEDKVLEQMDKRITKRSDEFSNKDLLDYHRAIQDVLSKSNNSIDPTTPIIINNKPTQINVGIEDGMTRAQRQQVLDVVNSIVNGIQTPEVIDSVCSEVEEE